MGGAGVSLRLLRTLGREPDGQSTTLLETSTPSRGDDLIASIAVGTRGALRESFLDYSKQSRLGRRQDGKADTPTDGRRPLEGYVQHAATSRQTSLVQR